MKFILSVFLCFLCLGVDAQLLPGQGSPSQIYYWRGHFRIDSTLSVKSLRGSGMRMVTVDSGGRFSTQTIPSGGVGQSTDTTSLSNRINTAQQTANTAQSSVSGLSASLAGKLNIADTGAMLTPFTRKAANLSDLTSASAARANLGLGTIATYNSLGINDVSSLSAALAARVMYGDTSAMLLPYMRKANNLSDVANPAMARTNLGLGTAATQSSTAFDAAGSATAAQAFSIQRGNHTGTQPASTITGLATVATSGSAGDLVGTLAAARIADGSLPLAKLSQSSAGTGDVISWNGSAWAASTPTGGATSWTVSGTNQYSSVSGNVGIGISSPTYKLDVFGNMRGREMLKLDGFENFDSYIAFGLDFAAIGALNGGGGFMMGTGVRPHLGVPNTLIKTNGPYAANFFYTRYDRGLEFHTGLQGAIGASFTDDANTRMIINNDGLIGMGTTSPNTLLDVNGITTLRSNVVYAYRAVSSTTSIGVGDYVVNATSGTFTITISTMVAGTKFYVKNSGSGTISLVSAGTIDGAAGYDVPAGLTAQLLSIGGGNYILLNQ